MKSVRPSRKLKTKNPMVERRLQEVLQEKRCGDPNHLIGECPKPPKEKNQRAFVGGSLKLTTVKEIMIKGYNETSLVAQSIKKKAFSDGGPINMGGPQSVQAAPKTIMRPPPVGTPGSEKNVSFQKSILGSRPKHMIVNNVKVSVASDDEIYLGVDMEPDEWIKDSGCSKHMMGNQKLFSSYKAYNGGNVIFGSNLRGNIIGKGQICDNKCRVTFSEHDSEITKDGKVIDEEEAIKVAEKKILENDIEDETLEIDKIVNIKESRNHPLKNVIGNLNQRTLRLVAQGYNQQEGIDYDETYAPDAVVEKGGFQPERLAQVGRLLQSIQDALTHTS
ncbi:hypothetical protein Tco_1482533 [Tanacetum coccineum]